MASAGVRSITLATLAICANQRVMVIAPVQPSTRSIMPVLMIFVACPVPTTAGRPYSRHTIAAWLITPPTSVTQAPILANAGAQDGEVVGATRISPSCNWPTSLTVLHTRALPSMMPGLPAKPFSSVMVFGSLTSCTDAQSASDLLVTPQRTMVKGSWITSGAVPMAGGGLHSLNFCITPLRQRISLGQVVVPRGVTPVAHAVTISHNADLIRSDGRRRAPLLELLHHAFAPENFLGPGRGAARGDAGRPRRDDIPQRRLDQIGWQAAGSTP